MTNPNFDHGWEVLYNSTGTLATQPGTIKVRLARAYKEIAVMKELGADELVPEALVRLSQMFKRLGSVDAIEDLDENEACDFAKEIYSAFIIQSRDR